MNCGRAGLSGPIFSTAMADPGAGAEGGGGGGGGGGTLAEAAWGFTDCGGGAGGGAAEAGLK